MKKLWDDKAWEDYKEWLVTDKKINELIKDIERNGLLNGIGKPEKLKYVDGDVYGTVSCSSEYDSMSRFEEIYLKKVGEKYYILDLLIS